jgi:hypothetical protein
MEYTYVTPRKLKRNFNELNFGVRKLGPKTGRKNNRKMNKARGIIIVPDEKIKIELIKKSKHVKNKIIRIWNNICHPKKQIKIYR